MCAQKWPKRNQATLEAYQQRPLANIGRNFNIPVQTPPSGMAFPAKDLAGVNGVGSTFHQTRRTLKRKEFQKLIFCLNCCQEKLHRTVVVMVLLRN